MPQYPATKVPPSCENISIELAQQVLAKSWGNIAQAAEALGVPSRDFRFMVRMTPALTAVVEEASELFCDRAEGILRDALESENELRRDVAARFVLSGKGAPRGWTRPSSPAVTIEQPPRQITLKWLDGTAFDMHVGGSREPALIDAKPEDGERGGENISVPRYDSGRGDGCVEGEVAKPAALIEHQDATVPEQVASTPTLPVWPGPYPPPPLVAHLYAPFTPAPRVAPARPSTPHDGHRARLSRRISFRPTIGGLNG
jgi:hypothetical protein